MQKILTSAFVMLAFTTVAANANWSSVTDRDNGARFYVTAKGGATYIQAAKMENDMGSLTVEYFTGTGDGLEGAFWTPISAPSTAGAGNSVVIGFYDMGALDAVEKLSNVTMFASIGLGFVLPNATQWRVEGSWDHYAKFSADAPTLFRDQEPWNYTVGSDSDSGVFTIKSGSMSSTVQTDMYMLMFYRDFFRGVTKPLNTFIPYVGLGFGYADITTTMQLNDIYGNLSEDANMQSYGPPVGADKVVHFYKSDTKTQTVALAGSLGASYGFGVGQFFDVGLKVAYIDKIQWAVNNEKAASIDETVAESSRDIVSSHNNFYGTAYVGVRFEF